MDNEPSGPWVEPMLRINAVDPRNGRASWNRLAKMCGLSTSTVTSMAYSRRKTSTGTVQRVAEKLDVPSETVSKWIRQGRPVRERYEPPPEADLLSDRQRKALNVFIRTIVTEETVAMPDLEIDAIDADAEVLPSSGVEIATESNPVKTRRPPRARRGSAKS